jgi:anti-anti-sigma factor
MTLITPPSAEVDQCWPGEFSAVVDPSGRIALAGQLDITRLDMLHGILDEALERTDALVYVDVSELSFIDPAAVSVLLSYQLLLAVRQRRLWLDPVSVAVEAVLDLFDLHHILGSKGVAASSSMTVTLEGNQAR